MTRKYLGMLGAVTAVLLGVSACASVVGRPIPAYTTKHAWLTNSYGPVQLYHDGVPDSWHSSWAIMNTGACHTLPEGAVPTYWFGDYNTFAGAVADGEIGGTKATPNGCKFHYMAVVVDYENWSYTPLSERQQWKTYVKKAYTLAQSHGMTVIQAMTHGVPADGGCASGWSGYFSCGAAGYEAQYANVVDIQAQQEEADLDGKFGSFNYEVNTGAEQAKKANPNVVVLAGMRSSAPEADGSCTLIPAATLVSDWDAVSGEVSGAWLNFNCNESSFAPLMDRLA